MSDKEVRRTIKRQILIVFFLPLIFAIMHTIAGLGMISQLLSVLLLFDKTLILIIGVIVAVIFMILYGLTYLLTSKAYYRIVKQMN